MEYSKEIQDALYEALKELTKLQKQGNITIHGNSKFRDTLRQALAKAEGK